MKQLNDDNKGDKAYVLYTFFDEDTAKEIGIKEYTLAPNFLHRYPVRHNLVKLALKRFFDVEVQDDTLKMKTTGYRDDVYFSTSMCERVICVAVSTHPIGVGSQIPFDMGEPVEVYTSRYFHPNEIAECSKTQFADDTIFYMYSKKEALRKKYPEREFGYLENTDTTEQGYYTLQKDFCNGRDYYLAATDNAEFVKIDVKEVLP